VPCVGGTVTQKHYSEIALIAFLLFEESDVPLNSGMGESLIFVEPDSFKVC